MKLRKATLADGPAVAALYREAQAFLAAQGIDQWQDGYPNEETFQEDVARGESWVLEDGSPPTTPSTRAPGAQRPRSTPSSTASPCPAPARARARPLGSSKSWSARPGSGACPACGGTPTGRTKSCSASWRKTACPAGASSTWRMGESAWPLRSCCKPCPGTKKGARWPLLLSCVGGYFSRTYFCGELESFFMSLISNMSRLSKKGVSLEKPKLRTSKSV